MERVTAYIDGFNLYFGLKDSNWRRFYWLDPALMVRNLLRPHQQLVAVNYFSARIGGPREKAKRQSTYLEALETLDGLEIHLGHYQTHSKCCANCGTTWSESKEKKTDVNIAVQLLTDAYEDKFDTAFLISGDSDLCPPIEQVRKKFPHKRIIIAFPPKRFSQQLTDSASTHLKIGRAIIAKSQLQEIILNRSGFALTRPESWKS